MTSRTDASFAHEDEYGSGYGSGGSPKNRQSPQWKLQSVIPFTAPGTADSAASAASATGTATAAANAFGLKSSLLTDRKGLASVRGGAAHLNSRGGTAGTAGTMGSTAPSTAGISSRERLLLPLETIRDGEGNLALIMCLRALLSLSLTAGEEVWLHPLVQWIEVESRARLGRFVSRIQRLARRRQARLKRSERSLARLEEDLSRLHLKAVVKCQTVVRQFVHRRRAVRRAQVFLIRYDPHDGAGYWYNPSTGVSSWTKPKILGSFDSRVISLPPPGLEVIVKCSSCAKAAAVNCVECEDSYCKLCFESMHCKGSRVSHRYQRIPYCSYCRFQMAAKSCASCVMQRPRAGSLQALMRPYERGLYCDSCYASAHDEAERARERQGAEQKQRERAFVCNTREAYLAMHQLRQRVITNHRYDHLIQVPPL
jgi:hypothetical protein